MTNRNVVDVETFIDKHPISRFQWLMFLCCFGVALLDGLDTAAIGYIAPAIVQEWGVQKSELAPVLSAALFGLACGALCSGPIADRFGRRMLVVYSVLLFGVASAASAFSPSLFALTIMRLVTGVGLGAAMPTAVTLLSEYSPRRKRSLSVNMMFCGFPLGAGLGGVVSAWLIPTFGWRSVLLIGGVLPVALATVLLFVIPESVAFLVATNKRSGQVWKTLAKIAPLERDTVFALQKAGVTRQGGVKMVLSRDHIFGSLMLWLTFFMGLLIYYSIVNWMPLLLREAGVDAGSATLVAALFPLGGLGAIFAGSLMDRYNPLRVVALCYALTGAALAAVGHVSSHLSTLMAIILLAGTLMNTAQACLPALAAASYPTEGRATGVAWMLGIGRFGGIAGSFLVAELSRRQVSMVHMFYIIAVPAAVACAALLLKEGFKTRERSAAVVASGSAVH